MFEAGERADAAGEALHSALRLDGAFVGIVDLRVVPLHRSGEVGYWLAYAAVGKGVMTRAVAELFDIGFETLGLHRIQLQPRRRTPAAEPLPSGWGCSTRASGAKPRRWRMGSWIWPCTRRSPTSGRERRRPS